MQAVVIDQGSLTIQERPTPVPAPGSVLVEVRAAGVNAADLLQVRGFYPAPPGWPEDVPGLELAGEVVAVGPGVDGAWLGERVCAIVGGGGQASHALVPAAHLLRVPDSVSWEQAGGFAEAFVTAYDALVLQGRLAKGDRVLISGASGGVGSAAVQIAHHLGADVVAVSRTLDHHQALRALGANEVVTIDDVASLRPIDVVLELVGAAHLEQAQRVLAPFARVVVIGVGAGAKASINLLTLMGTRATITGSTLRSRTNDEKADVIARVGAALLPAWSQGELRVVTSAAFNLTDVAQAYEYFATPGKFGKVVLHHHEH